jgi:hypothetical protein
MYVRVSRSLRTIKYSPVVGTLQSYCNLLYFKFNYLILGEHGLPAPIYLPASHPIALRRAAVCLYSGMQSIGDGANVPEAKNSSAKAMWLKLGHMITLDPR